LKEDIAVITVNPETRQILDIHFYERNLRSKCKRCAIFCCKLGAPGLTKKDIKQMKSAGYDISEFIEPSKRRYGNFSFTPSMVKSNKDGSCIFLKTDKKPNTYECLIYGIRPTLCRLYPFDFERINANAFLLKIIPCCKGLNNPDGELVNKSFIIKHLLDSIFDLTSDKV